MAKAVRKPERHEESKAISKQKLLSDIIRDATSNIIYHCTHAADNRAECILRHVEEMDSTLVSTYLSEKLQQIYMSLSEEDQEQIAHNIQKKLLTYLKKLCDVYRRRRQAEEFEEEDVICSSL